MGTRKVYLLLIGAVLLGTGLAGNSAVMAEEIRREAESADTIEAPMQIWTDRPDASGGAYIAVAPGNNDTGNPPSNGTATYDITVEGGDYKMLGRVIAPSGDDDSFWLRIVDAAGEVVQTNTNNHSSGWIRYTND